MDKLVLLIVLIGGWALYSWKPKPVAPPPVSVAPAPVAPPARPQYRCDGRIRCSQMRSCEEATWFLQHCPGTKMDGNHDGIPCERQWCGH